MGHENLKNREMRQKKKLSRRVKKSKGGLNVLLDRGRKAKRGGGLQPPVSGREIYAAVKLGYSLLYGALPVPQPPRLPCTHLTTLTFMLTQKHVASSLLLFPLHALPSLSLTHPHHPCLTIAGTEGVCGVKVKYIIDFDSLSHFSLHIFPPLPIYPALPRLPAFEESG